MVSFLDVVGLWHQGTKEAVRSAIDRVASGDVVPVTAIPCILGDLDNQNRSVFSISANLVKGALLGFRELSVEQIRDVTHLPCRLVLKRVCDLISARSLSVELVPSGNNARELLCRLSTEQMKKEIRTDHLADLFAAVAGNIVLRKRMSIEEIARELRSTNDEILWAILLIIAQVGLEISLRGDLVELTSSTVPPQLRAEDLTIRDAYVLNFLQGDQGPFDLGELGIPEAEILRSLRRLALGGVVQGRLHEWRFSTSSKPQFKSVFLKPEY